MFQLVPETDPVLYRPARPVRDDEIGALCDLKFRWSLGKFMAKRGGIGIAGPQLGDARCWFYWTRGLVVNPQVVWVSEQQEEAEEGCLSFPGRKVRVLRPVRIAASFVDETGTRRQDYVDFQARVFLHEYDHLLGRCLFRSPEAQLSTPNPN